MRAAAHLRSKMGLRKREVQSEREERAPKPDGLARAVRNIEEGREWS